MIAMQNIPPSIFNAYNVCSREAWLMWHNIVGDQDNGFLDLGRFLEANTFERDKKKIYIADLNAEVDMIRKKDGDIMVAEIKKSSRAISSSILQLKYYLYLLKFKKGICDVKGVLKIPREHKSIDIALTIEDKSIIEEKLKIIHETIELEKCPVAVRLKCCDKCAHCDFCWA